MKNMTLRTKLLSLFLVVGLLPFAIIAGVAYFTSSNSLEKQAFNQLVGVRDIKKEQIGRFFDERQGDMGVLTETVKTLRFEAFNKLIAVRDIKKAEIERYFAERFGDVSVLAGNDTVKAALTAFDEAFQNEDQKVGGSQWSEVERQYAPWLKQYREEYGYYDLFLINGDGDVVYTVCRESDLGENLVNGSLKSSSLGECFADARSGTAIADFKPYAPSNNEPCAFIGAPIKEDNETTGVVALQIPLTGINAIMCERAGMGKTGETYLVGPDKLMRSDSFLDQQNHTVVASFKNPAKGSVDTVAANEALAGKTGEEVIAEP